MSHFTAELKDYDVLGLRMNLILNQNTNKEDNVLVGHQPNIFIMISAKLFESVKTSNIKDIGYLTSLLHDFYDSCVTKQKLDMEALHNNIQPAIEQVINLLHTTAHAVPCALPVVECLFGLIDALLLISSAYFCVAYAPLNICIIFVLKCVHIFTGRSFANFHDLLMNAAIKMIDEQQQHHTSVVAINTIRAVITHAPTVASVFCDHLIASAQRLLQKLHSAQWESTPLVVRTFIS